MAKPVFASWQCVVVEAQRERFFEHGAIAAAFVVRGKLASLMPSMLEHAKLRRLKA